MNYATNDASANTRHGVSDLVKMLDIILTDCEWAQLIDMIGQADRERHHDRRGCLGSQQDISINHK